MLFLARAECAREMLDGPVALSDLRESLLDIGRFNALFGGHRITLRQVKRLVAALPVGRRLTVLDVGTGMGDIPRALVDACRRAGRPIRVLAVDRDLATLQLARAASLGYPEIAFVQADAVQLPVRNAGLDVAMSALTLHHLEPDPAVQSLAEMDRASRRGLVVNDLARGRIAWLVVWLVTRALAKSAVSRHDGPLSVRRAYTPDEVRALSDKAGLAGARVLRYPMALRLCLVRAR